MQVSNFPSFVFMGLAGGDIMYLVLRVISQDHLIERACKFIGGIPLCYHCADKSYDHKNVMVEICF